MKTLTLTVLAVMLTLLCAHAWIPISIVCETNAETKEVFTNRIVPAVLSEHPAFLKCRTATHQGLGIVEHLDQLYLSNPVLPYFLFLAVVILAITLDHLHIKKR